MKKCTRCNNVIDWDKPFCPLCGGSVTDVQGHPRIVPGVPEVVEKISSAQRASVPVPPPPPKPPVPSFPQTEVPLPPAPSVPPMRVPAQTAPLYPAAPVSSGEDRLPPAPLPPAVPPVPPAPQARLFSQIHQTPSAPTPPASPLAEVISPIHQAAAGTPLTPPPPSPQPGGFFSQIHQSPHPFAPQHPVAGTETQEKTPSALPKFGTSSVPNANAGPLGGQGADRSRPRVTLQELTEGIDESDASLGNALDVLLKSGPPLDFTPPPPAMPPRSFISPADEGKSPLPFAVEHIGDDGADKKDVLSPNLAEIMGINSLADLTDNALETVPKTAPQTPVNPQIPPPFGQAVPNMPDDRSKGPDSGDDSDFLKMFPGVGG